MTLQVGVEMQTQDSGTLSEEGDAISDRPRAVARERRTALKNERLQKNGGISAARSVVSSLLGAGCRVFVLASLFGCSHPQSPVQESESAGATKDVEKYVFAKRTADFPEIRESGRLRVGLPYSRTNFFLEKDRFRGFEFELFHELEKELKTSRQRGEPSLGMVFHLAPVANLISDLTEGKVDVAAGIVITEERKRLVEFTQPYLTGIHAVVVSNNSTPPISSLEGLSGQSVLVNRGSSYPGLLEQLGQELKKKGLAPPKIELVETLETEDIFDLVNSGAISWTIAHEHHANLWKQVLPNLRVYPDLTLGEPAQFAWAVRRGNPELLKVLNAFVARNRQGTMVGNMLLKRYYKSPQWISDPVQVVNQEHLKPFITLFKKSAERHLVSWIGLAAVAFQESRFDPTLRSRAGAVGLMQIRPETAAEVGIVGIEDPEKNVEAAARYFDFLAEKYFNETGLDRNDRVAFILAAYNAGPTRIQRLRRQAPEQGVDPNRWFGQMESLVLQEVGREPVGYVSNVAKYYLCLSRILLTAEERASEGLDLR